MPFKEKKSIRHRTRRRERERETASLLLSRKKKKKIRTRLGIQIYVWNFAMYMHIYIYIYLYIRPRASRARLKRIEKEVGSFFLLPADIHFERLVEDVERSADAMYMHSLMTQSARPFLLRQKGRDASRGLFFSVREACRYASYACHCMQRACPLDIHLLLRTTVPSSTIRRSNQSLFFIHVL